MNVLYYVPGFRDSLDFHLRTKIVNCDGPEKPGWGGLMQNGKNIATCQITCHFSLAEDVNREKKTNRKVIFDWLVPFGKRGILQKLVQNFRVEFPMMALPFTFQPRLLKILAKR